MEGESKPPLFLIWSAAGADTNFIFTTIRILLCISIMFIVLDQSRKVWRYLNSLLFSPPRCLLPLSDQKTLFLDLDHTLIVSLEEPPTEKFAAGDQIMLRFMEETLYVIKRPGVEQLLRSAIASNYEIVIFTAGTKLYASPVIDWLDPNREFISHRLYRDACTITIDGKCLKDLSVTGRRLDRSVVIDDSPTVYGKHRENVIPVSPFHGDPGDVELLNILWFFEFEKQFKDLRLAVKNY
ncbi:CTD small phosphatase-like protein [Rhynchospora pubera]|uniref:CTD small phosphatase-like protein n=1 Tax=Rhynchospora pubera TaxID=906938 RepID=A0AAV8DCQ9_9POAL|nr:CTD small phosphatase-like protein [Rhynchospora pubera]